jgi:hypothetical protein
MDDVNSYNEFIFRRIYGDSVIFNQNDEYNLIDEEDDIYINSNNYFFFKPINGKKYIGNMPTQLKRRLKKINKFLGDTISINFQNWSKFSPLPNYQDYGECLCSHKIQQLCLISRTINNINYKCIVGCDCIEKFGDNIYLEYKNEIKKKCICGNKKAMTKLKCNVCICIDDIKQKKEDDLLKEFRRCEKCNEIVIKKDEPKFKKLCIPCLKEKTKTNYILDF